MRHIVRAVAHKLDAQQNGATAPIRGESWYDTEVFSARKPQSPATPAEQQNRWGRELAVNILPPHNETETLLKSYFSNTGLLFPYIHEQTFFETYYDLKRQGFSTNVRRTWLGLLNMMLAMARCTTGPIGEGKDICSTPSDIFYRRAKELCKTQMLRGTTLETGMFLVYCLNLLAWGLLLAVQYLLLTSQYLQGTQKSLQTWTTHGLAVKAALSIGLHSGASSNSSSLIEREMRKRTWYGCILLDRSLSMTFGRPCSIPEEYIKIELPLPLGDAKDDLGVLFYNSTM
jgi:hypothetical protein